MKKPWLIQRGQIGEIPGRKGIDGIVSWDYMGSAEFEFGALPSSLKRIRSSAGSYITFDFPISDRKILSAICKSSDLIDLKLILQQLAEGKMRLKENSELSNWAHPERHDYKTRNDFWWDLDNDWMAWEKNNEFQSKLLASLGIG